MMGEGDCKKEYSENEQDMEQVHNMEIEPYRSFGYSARSSSSSGRSDGPGDGAVNSFPSKKPSERFAGGLNFMSLWKRNKGATRVTDNVAKIGSTLARGIKEYGPEEDLYLRLCNVSHTRFQRFSFEKLQAATLNFNAERLLRRGRCMHRYIGYVDDVGQVVIERFFSAHGVTTRELFLAEARALASLRHRNITIGVGWCHEDEEFLVVHELPPKGNLHSLLHTSEIPLSWEARYKISLDLANAILYIHEGYEYCILHRNIQSVNILVDSDSSAKLSSFYGAKFVDKDNIYEASLSTWTIEYSDPAYLASHVYSMASDVFSFGIVLIEIVTGTFPRFEGPKSYEEKNSKLWDLYEKNMLLEAVDKRLKGKFNKEQLARLLLMGLLCSLPSRESRPSLREVLRYLNFEDIWLNSTFTNAPSSAALPSSIGEIAEQGDLDIKLDNHENLHLEASFELEDDSDDEHEQFSLAVGTAISSETFDIGIPPNYNCSGQVNHFQSKIIEGFLSSLDEKIKRGDQFHEIMEAVKIFTKAIVAIHAPLDRWSSLMQYILGALKEIENVRTVYEVEMPYKTAGMELERHIDVVKEDKKELVDANRKLASSRKQQMSLRDKFDNLQRHLTEVEGQLRDVENICNSLKDDVDTIGRRRRQNKEKLKRMKLERKIVELYESVFSKIALDLGQASISENERTAI